jgi:two-component system OmpR family response regulator
MRLLIVEDDPTIAMALQRMLKRSYQTERCERADEAQYLASVNDYAAIILDLGLPDRDGIELCRSLRLMAINVPILILTGRSEEAAKVAALDAGADDYLTKPFSSNELTARIRALLRRGLARTLTPLESGRLRLDPVTRQASYGGAMVPLRRKEFDLLEFFMCHPNQALSRSQILDQLWDHDNGLVTNTVDVHVKHLRDRVDRPYGVNQIQTVHGIGYKFVPQPKWMDGSTRDAK